MDARLTRIILYLQDVERLAAFYRDALAANALVGGSNRSIALQPLSVEGSVGVNLALGVAGLTLR